MLIYAPSSSAPKTLKVWAELSGCTQTRVQVNLHTFKIHLFEIADIVANSCPGSSACYGAACAM